MPITNPIKCRKLQPVFSRCFCSAISRKKGKTEMLRTWRHARPVDIRTATSLLQQHRMTGRETRDGETITERERGREEREEREREKRDRRDNRVEQVGKTLKRAANAFITTLDSTLVWFSATNQDACPAGNGKYVFRRPCVK